MSELIVISPFKPTPAQIIRGVRRRIGFLSGIVEVPDSTSEAKLSPHRFASTRSQVPVRTGNKLNNSTFYTLSPTVQA